MEFMRSAMFVPGHRQRFLDKALAGLPTDVIMLDLEDGVPPQEKAAGRELTAEAVGRPRVGRTLRYVRINALASPWFADDVAAVVRPGVDGLVLPKVDTVQELQQADAQVGAREAAAGVAHGTVRFIVAIESPRGLLNV